MNALEVDALAQAIHEKCSPAGRVHSWTTHRQLAVVAAQTITRQPESVERLVSVIETLQLENKVLADLADDRLARLEQATLQLDLCKTSLRHHADALQEAGVTV